MDYRVRSLVSEDLEEFRQHFQRHRGESGRGEPHFMPFAPGDPHGPTGLRPERLELSLSERSWQRWFVARPPGSDEIIGHANLEGDGLKVGLHRCELGIGVERPHRGHGVGRVLLQTALDFARQQATLRWVDLRVFGQNTAGQRLYGRMGFVEIGRIADRFRIEGESIDDVLMTLDVTS